jgi:hypothetical protein
LLYPVEVEEACQEVESAAVLILEAFWAEDQAVVSIPELVEEQNPHIPLVEVGP